MQFQPIDEDLGAEFDEIPLDGDFEIDEKVSKSDDEEDEKGKVISLDQFRKKDD